MKRMVLAVFLSSSVAAIAAVGLAGAQQAGPGQVDGPGADPRGTMTRAQAQAAASALFARRDVNHDGKLDPADRAAQAALRFDAIDTDHNGQISRAEFTAIDERGPGRGFGPGPGPGRRPGPGEVPGMQDDGPDMRPGGPLGVPRAMHLDAGADGSAGPRAIGQAEFVAAALKRFDQADANHDGTLTRAEREANRPGGRDAIGRMGDGPGPAHRPIGDPAERPMGRGDGVPMPPPPPDTPGPDSPRPGDPSGGGPASDGR